MSLICPHCEKPLSSHDPGPCRRKFTRRFFFGLMAGAVGAKVAGSEISLKAGDRIAFSINGTMEPFTMKTIWDRHHRLKVNVIANKIVGVERFDDFPFHVQEPFDVPWSILK